MRKNKMEGHLAMFVSKTFSGLNANALKFLVPVWMTPLAGVTFRMLFGTAALWATDIFLLRKEGRKRGNVGKKEIIRMLLTGVFGFYVFQLTYLTSLKYTTPVSVSILGSLMPVWTFLFGIIIYKSERFTWNKILGLSISIGGAILSMFAKRPPEIASNPLLGDSLAILSSVAYSLYLLYSQKLLKIADSITMLKWAFTGAAITASCVDITFKWGPFDTSGLLAAPILDTPVQITPVLVLLFVLFFPTVISYLLLETGLRLLPATVVASYNNVLIVVATITSLALGQDVFSWVQAGSIALLFTGLYFISRPHSI